MDIMDALGIVNKIVADAVERGYLYQDAKGEYGLTDRGWGMLMMLNTFSKKEARVDDDRV